MVAALPALLAGAAIGEFGDGEEGIGA